MRSRQECITEAGRSSKMSPGSSCFRTTEVAETPIATSCYYPEVVGREAGRRSKRGGILSDRKDEPIRST